MGLKLNSCVCIVFLFGLLFAIVFVIGLYFRWSLLVIMGALFFIILMQYVLGPYIIRLLYRVEWMPYEEFQSKFPHLAEVVDKVVAQSGIKTPRMGLIHDKNPNAFTFGHTKNNARIVITQGILEYLTPEEQKAVVGHELGHVVHNDFILMTIAFAIPLVLIYFSRWCYHSSRAIARGSRGKGAPIAAILLFFGLIAYIGYWIGFFVSLLVSRIREYYADEHAAEVTGDPNTLSMALVKIAYGLLYERNVEDNRRSSVRGLKSLGIFDPKIGTRFALASSGGTGGYSKNTIEAAAAWDLFNPWAKYYQLFSTHPLPAKRIMRLNEQCKSYAVNPEIDFSNARKIKEEQAGKSMFPEFLLDVSMVLLPILIFIAVGILTIVYIIVWIFTPVGIFMESLPLFNDLFINLILFWAIGFFIIGLGMILRIEFKYKVGFEPKSVEDLVTQVKASPIRTIPAILEGKIIGRGIPGYYFGEDMILLDNTGIMYLDYESLVPIIGNVIFARKTIRKYFDQQVRIVGWYRRGPSPYVEIKNIKSASGQRNDNYRKQASYIWAVIAFGIAFYLFYLWNQGSHTGFFGLF